MSSMEFLGFLAMYLCQNGYVTVRIIANAVQYIKNYRSIANG